MPNAWKITFTATPSMDWRAEDVNIICGHQRALTTLLFTVICIEPVSEKASPDTRPGRAGHSRFARLGSDLPAFLRDFRLKSEKRERLSYRVIFPLSFFFLRFVFPPRRESISLRAKGFRPERGSSSGANTELYTPSSTLPFPKTNTSRVVV